jgi:hypothetical protein
VAELIGKNVDIVAHDWKKSGALDGVSVVSGTHSDTTNSSGNASFTAFTDTSLTLQANRPVPTAEATLTFQAVNLQDAIAILKMIVGLDVNGAGNPLLPYQALAADFDGNGAVQLTDAIGVLKHVVGLTAPDPTWHFVDASNASLTSMANLNPGHAPAIDIDISSTSSPVHVSLVGYLTGDVDGSFSSPLWT